MMWLVDTQPTFRLDVGSASVGTVTVDVTRANGTSIATGASTTDNADGTYDYTLSAANNTQLDVLRLDWHISSETVTTFEEIVGSLLFTLEQAKAREIVGGQAALANEDDTTLAGWRSAITELFEQRTGRSWISRYCRLETSGSGGYRLSVVPGYSRRSDGHVLRRPGRLMDITSIIAVDVGGTAQTVGDLVIDGSAVRHTTATWSRPDISDPLNVTVEYAYGLQTVEWEAQQRALELLLANAVPGSEPSRATSFSNEDGTYSITTFPTNVENFLQSHDARVSFA